MSYVTKVLSSNERLLTVTGLHWIYFAEGLFWLVLLTSAGFLTEYFLYTKAGVYSGGAEIDLYWFKFSMIRTPIPIIGFGAGMAVFLPLLVQYVSSEIGLTSQRIIHKSGLFFIKIEQVDLEDIAAENVIHGWFGWILGYGRLRFDCRFVHDMYLPAIRDPYRLVKASHIARMKHPEINYGAKELNDSLEKIESRRCAAELGLRLQALKKVIKGSFRRAS